MPNADLNSKIDECMRIYAEEILAEKIMKVLREALASTVTMFDVHRSVQFGPLSVFVEEQGVRATRLGAQIVVRQTSEPCPISTEDNPGSIGAKILACYQVSATIDYPSIHNEVQATIVEIDRAAQFARIIYAACRRLENLMFWDREFLGRKFKETP